MVSRHSCFTALASLLIPFAAGCSVGTRIDYASLFSRQGWQRTDRVIETLDIQPGDHVADLGAGEGYFSFYLAEAVGPTGRVYAVDIDPDALATLEREAEERGYSNIVVVHATPTDSKLPRDVDLVFLCNAYHHIDEREAYFTGLHEHLAPGARLAIVDGKSEGAATWFIPHGHSLEPGQLEEELGRAGYVHTASHDFLPMQTFDLFARKPE
jgi:cyclopropane fatty-acyl-phospholipid synthase-like methyltransferase